MRSLKTPVKAAMNGSAVLTNLIRKTRHLGLCALALAALSAAAPANAADYEWRFFTSLGLTDKGTQLHKAFAQDISDATNGRLAIKVFVAGEMPYQGSDVLRVIASRQVEMGHMAVGFIAGDLPAIGAFSMPFECTSTDAFFEKAMPAVKSLVESEMEKKFKVKPLLHWINGSQNMFLREPVTGPEDLKGRKIRAWNREQIETMKALGGSGVSITTTEVMPALQRGIIDGAFTSNVTANAWNIADVVKHAYVIDLSLSHEIIAVNEAALNELPDDLQKIVLDKSQEWTETYWKEIKAADTAARKTLTEKGLIYKDATPEEISTLQALTRPIGDAWAEKHGPVAQKMLATVRETCN